MIQLRSMTRAEYQAWFEFSVADYADQKSKAGFFRPEEAYQKSKEEFNKILPEGIETPNHFLYSIVDDTLPEPVGSLWFCNHKGQAGPIAFIYQLEINPAYRRHGYGEAAMRLLEAKVRELGLDTIELNVFGWNLAARALYEKVGYIPAAITMNKKLS